MLFSKALCNKKHISKFFERGRRIKIYYNKAADEWLEALPIGNGRLGAMIYGDPAIEKIQLNEDSLWSGYPVESYRGLNKDTYAKAKEEVNKGLYKEAMTTLERAKRC